MSNRAQRRAAARQASKAVPPLCPSGEHAYGLITGTYRLEAVASRVVCSKCRRPIEVVLEEQPEELARYRAFLESERMAE